MGLISTTIPNLVNGVSQQPYSLRLASQCQAQVNGHSSVVEGLRKRSGTRHIARFDDITSDQIFIHTINRDATEQYVLVVSNGALRVFDLAGVEKTVTFPNGAGYLSATKPAEQFRCVTVADYTFVLNANITVTEGSSVSSSRPPEALVWVKQGSYGSTYKVFLGGTEVASFTTPDGSQASHITQVATDYIAEQLKTQLVANATSYAVTRYGSTLYIKRNDEADFTIQTDDSLGDNGVSLIKGKVQRFSELPARAVDGFTVEIAGDQSSSFDNYYVQYTTDNGGVGSGTWKETLEGGITDSLQSSTMPHALIRQADGTFTFQELSWVKRRVGDAESNPMPSFVGRKLNDIFFHRNRLGVISDENVVFSKVGEYFDFFRGTATATLDDDPIDVGVSHVKVSILRHAIPFNETLLLFSDKTQFQLGSAEILTPETVSINQTTEYECSLRAQPVGAGRFVYFAVNRGTFTGIREYYVDGQTESEDASDITGHVPKYLPGGVFKLVVSGNEDVLIALSDQSPNAMYVYKYHWGGNEKLQASWSKWEFDAGGKILNCEFIESKLYMVVQRHDGTHLEVLNMEPGAVEENWNLAVHLDRVVTEYTAASITFLQNDPTLELDDTTRILLPYQLASGEEIQVVTAPGGSRVPGVIITKYTTGVSGTQTYVDLPGDWTLQPFFIGRPYEFRYRFSYFAIKEEAVGGGQLTVGEGRLQVRKASLLYNDTGRFKVEVTPKGRDTYTYLFSGRVVGSLNNIIGQVSIEQGKFTFPVAAKNDQVEIELVNDSFLPCHFLSAEWEAYYTIRSRRV